MRKVFFLFFLTLISCDRIPNDVLSALNSAGDNRNELQRVIDHYKSQKSQQKLKAAYFLISNMTTHYSLDTSGYISYLSILSTLDSIRLVENNDDTIRLKINKIWDNYQKDRGSINSNPLRYDLQHIKAEALINHIDRKFTAWKSNPYSKRVSFNTFCSYILPYRLNDRILPDDYFIYNNNLIIEKANRLYSASILETIDSILIKYGDIIYAADMLGHFPYLTTSSVMKSKRIECEDRVWFNYYLLSSAAFPVAIDFIPNWGNRNASHTWNTIVMDDQTFPFEPFYSTDRWEYRNIYNNQMEDGFVKWWGKFRLPKVFRVTYEKIENDIIKDDRVSAEDIPTLFRSDRVKDVSGEYFETADVKLTIEREIPDDTYYAYLCVQNREQWVPVQYGRIRGNQVLFRDMGKDIVYLPIFYRQGKEIPAGEPFYLSQNGKIKPITLDGKAQKMHISRRYPLNEKKALSNALLKGAVFSLANKADFSDEVICAKIDFAPEMKKYMLKNSHQENFRYVRFLYPKKAYLSEIKLLVSNKMSITDTIVLNSTTIDSKLASHADKSENEIIIDMGMANKVLSFGFCGLNDIFAVMPDVEYELFYWKDRWVSLGKARSENSSLIYKSVPSGGLYYLDCSEKDAFKRMFTYKDGKQLFW